MQELLNGCFDTNQQNVNRVVDKATETIQIATPAKIMPEAIEMSTNSKNILGKRVRRQVDEEEKVPASSIKNLKRFCADLPIPHINDGSCSQISSPSQTQLQEMNQMLQKFGKGKTLKDLLEEHIKKMGQIFEVQYRTLLNQELSLRGKHSPTPSNTASASSHQAKELVDTLFDFTDDEYDEETQILAKRAVKQEKIAQKRSSKIEKSIKIHVESLQDHSNKLKEYPLSNIAGQNQKQQTQKQTRKRNKIGQFYGLTEFNDKKFRKNGLNKQGSQQWQCIICKKGSTIDPKSHLCKV